MAFPGGIKWQFIRDERGQSLVIFAFLLVALVGLASLVIDVGLAYRQDSRLQAVADAAALAAAQELPDDPDGARAVAEQYIAAHGIDVNSQDHEISILTPYNSEDTAVEVTIDGNVEYVLGGVAGVFGATVHGRAVADVDQAEYVPYSDASIIALDPDACKALEVNASAAFKVEGPIKINSDCSNFASEFSCGATCQAEGGIQAVGGLKMDEKCVECDVTAIPPFGDPLAGVLPPCFTGGATPCTNIGTLQVRNGTAANPQLLQDSDFSFQPGIYYGGIEVSGTVKDWAPGVYVIAGGGIKLNTSTAFKAEGVFIYNTNDPGCPSCSKGTYGNVEFNTNSSAHLTAMTSGPYRGLLIFQDRNNAEPAKFNPGSSFGKGTVYFPNAHIDLNPSANAHLQIIANTIKINNSASFTAEWDPDVIAAAEGDPYIRLVE